VSVKGNLYTPDSRLKHSFHAGHGRVAYTVVCFVTRDCTGGLLTRYPIIDSIMMMMMMNE